MKTRLTLLALLAAALCPAAENSFYLPIRNNDLPALRKLIQNPGPKTLDDHGNSPLMYAASLGSLDSMRLLIDAGADPNVANEFGATPLMWCAGDIAKVRLLVAKSADVNAKSKIGRTPLMVAAAYGGAIEVQRLLIEKGADVKARDAGGFSILEQAAETPNIELISLLMDKGVDVNNTDEGGFTPLLVAAGYSFDNGAIVKLLIARGAKVNVTSGDTVEVVKNGPIALGHLTPLHLAANLGSYEAVEALIKAGADVNALDVRKATPLVFAVTTDHPNPKVVELLLASGAKPEPALPWALRYRNPSILSLLKLKPEAEAAIAAAVSADRASERDAIAKALTTSQAAASKFLATGGCASCHAQNLTGLAVAAAKPHAIKVDYELNQREGRSTSSLIGPLEQKLFQMQDPPPGPDGMEFAAMQMAAAEVAPTLANDALVHYVAGTQSARGDWPMASQMRPPMEDGSFSQTARGIRTLRVAAIPGRKIEFDTRVERAAAWLEKAEPLTTEDRTMQILGIVWAGHKAPLNRVNELIAKQHSDGGWGQTDYLGSDAYATGEALWALHESGIGASDPAWKRGVDFLLRTQQKDGTWHVVTRALSFQPYFESSFPHGHDQFISQAGTAMASIALSFVPD